MLPGLQPASQVPGPTGATAKPIKAPLLQKEPEPQLSPDPGPKAPSSVSHPGCEWEQGSPAPTAWPCSAGGQATTSPPGCKNRSFAGGRSQGSYQGAKKGDRVRGGLQGQGDLATEQNKLSPEEPDTHPSAAAQTGPRVLFDPLPVAAQAALAPAPSCMCELQLLQAQGTRSQRAHGARAALGAPCPSATKERERGSIKHK